MYIETSGWIAIGSKAWFISPSYQPASRTGGKCMQFWYHMYGNSIGQLNVYLKTRSGYPGTKVWTMSRNQGNQWLIGQVKITTSSSFNVSTSFEFDNCTARVICLLLLGINIYADVSLLLNVKTFLPTS